MGVRPLEVSLAGRDLTRIGDLVPAEAEAILDLAAELKLDPAPARAGRLARPALRACPRRARASRSPSR